MRHLLLCFSGWAGTGKDECTGHLVKKHKAVHTGLADPGKRHMLDAYGFSVEQLWGPSKFRNEGDPRYPKPELSKLGFVSVSDKMWGLDINPSNRKKILSIARELGRSGLEITYELQTNEKSYFTILVSNKDPKWFLSPRESLQKYMELMNTLYADTWIRKGINIHKEIFSGIVSSESYMNMTLNYDKTSGIIDDYMNTPIFNKTFISTFSDFRHIHEHRLSRKEASGTLIPVLIRIKRNSIMNPPFDHRSETEQTRIRDAAYDFIIDNNSTLEDLYRTVDLIVETCSDKNWFSKPWSEDFILSNESRYYTP